MADQLRVALVGMPFGVEAHVPSIQLGLLAALATRAGFPADTLHLNLDLAQRLGVDVYNALCLNRGHMTGEWLFSIAAFGSDAPQDDLAYLRAFPEEVEAFAPFGLDAGRLCELRRVELPQFIEDCLNQNDWSRYQVVGFSSTFQQHVASLALARRIKERYPAIKIVFGGANMEGEMGPEYVRAFPFIDYGVIGDGDEVFPNLLRMIAQGRRPLSLAGLALRTPGKTLAGSEVQYGGQAAPVHDLDSLPTPDYSEFFTRAHALGLLKEGQHVVGLPFESSRGCWWGAKHHCTFCGVSDLSMGYRKKSSERVFAELDELATKHRVASFYATDNIMDMSYVHDVFRTIQQERTDYRFFYEVKANLTQEQVRTLYLGGVRWLQPGIESLNSHVLGLMRKGSTMLQNIRMLKWCRYYGIKVFWNLIWGFPGEKEEDFREEFNVLQHLSHLQPPAGGSRIWLDRFSPNFTDRKTFPVHDVRPEASYSYVYPKHVALDKVAYYFDYSMDDTVPEEVHRPTIDWIAKWLDSWKKEQKESLTYCRLHDALMIEDQRSIGIAPGRKHTLRGPWAAAYELCSDTMRTLPQISSHMAERGALMEEWQIAAGLEDFCNKGLMVTEGGKYLSLALPMNPNW